MTKDHKPGARASADVGGDRPWTPGPWQIFRSKDGRVIIGIPRQSQGRPMTPELDLQAIQRRCDLATPGPWEAPGPCAVVSGAEPLRTLAMTWPNPANDDGSMPANATFIAHARTDLPALLEEVRRLREEVVFQRLELRASADLAARTALSPQGGGQGNKGSVASLPVVTADEPATPSEDRADG